MNNPDSWNWQGYTHIIQTILFILYNSFYITRITLYIRSWFVYLQLYKEIIGSLFNKFKMISFGV